MERLIILAAVLNLLFAYVHQADGLLTSRAFGILTGILNPGSRTESPLSVDNSDSNEVKELQIKAERLRQEVASFQKEKSEALEKEMRAVAKEMKEKQETRNRYSGEVPIFKEDGSTVVERVDFAPRYRDGSSWIDVCTAPLPLGMILGESEDFPGAVCVDEIAPDSNAHKAGIQVGDLLRACTATQTIMDAPAWQILAGGIGMPKTKRYMYSVDGRPFEEVMDALGSNRMDPDGRPVVLVLEKH